MSGEGLIGVHSSYNIIKGQEDDPMGDRNQRTRIEALIAYLNRRSKFRL